MNAPKLPLDRHWIEQTLTPYLRYAFSHALPRDVDLTPTVKSAIAFCMHKADFPTDGDDLLFERICLAIEFRYKNLAPELNIVIESLEPLARFLIRRAQLKGPYELLGRMNIASGAWQEHEAGRLKRLREAAENEKNENERPELPPPLPPKALPTDDKIDPRLVKAMPGQFLYTGISETLTVGEDQYYRHQNRLLAERCEKEAAPSWLEEVQQAAMATLPEYVSLPGGRIYGQQHVLPIQSHAPSYVPNLRQQQHPYQSYPPPQQQFRNPAIQHRAIQAPTHEAPIYTGPVATRYPIATAANAHALLNVHPTIPTSDISHLRGQEWSQTTEQRAREFHLLSQHEKAKVLLQAFQEEHYHKTHPPTPSREVSRPLSSSAASHTYSPPPPRTHSQQFQQLGSRADSQPRFVNHPAFSNITSAFPTVQRYDVANQALPRTAMTWGV